MNIRHHDLTQMRIYVDQAIGEVTEAMQKFNSSCDLPFQHMRGKVAAVLMKVMAHPAFGRLLSDLLSHDEYTFRHSIGVALISQWIGKAKGLASHELQLLTASALMHDIGKAQVPAAILNKAGRLTREEFELIKCHSEYGYKMLEGIPEASSRIAKVVLEHHEREDGSGYPYGITRERIDPFSKIVAVADVFHATISKRVYRDPMPVYTIMELMTRDEFGELEEETVLCLQRKVMNLLIGKRVQLSNGDKGRVVMIPFSTPLLPIIEVKGRIIDLQKAKGIYLESPGLTESDMGIRAGGSNLATE